MPAHEAHALADVDVKGSFERISEPVATRDGDEALKLVGLETAQSFSDAYNARLRHKLVRYRFLARSIYVAHAH